ncbi:MAG: hypothetical protein KBG00_07925 [Rhodoferax sp.]|jgi:hypothetical protein|uniref:phage minor head protein n=1 Tax=Rhodoferax sp. TaxID=50421 RepID=UPI001B57BA76|nr:phage minor head protein [Rhodoferax sp.]MBP9148696.1 hypothetical protein [Rhodoferax sp.]MBP9736270.1 hypothetical protein [Rhodoferax sp.]
MANPIIPGSIKDRTGSTAIVRRALVDIKRRYAGLKTDVLAIFGRIPIYQTNDEFSQVYYGLTPDQLAALSVELQAAYARWIASGKDPAHVFWYSVHIDDAQQMGTAQSVANLTALSETYAAARTLERVIYSQAYQTRLAMAQVKSYEHWTGLAAAQKSELSEIIGRAVIDGKNPKAVRTEIMERLEVSRSRAAQYAQTDITDTLRQARMAEADYTAENLGMKIGLLWTSALIPTTRPHHAARTGKVYTSEQVKQFYSVNGNRYRCHCAVTEALLDSDGKPILTDRLKASMAAEHLAWQKAQL